MKAFLKYTAFFMVCIVVFTGSSFVYLHFSKRAQKTNEQPSPVPYAAAPKEAEIRLHFPHSYATLFLDFENEELGVYTNNDEFRFAEEDYCFDIECTEVLVAGMIDRVGGLELNMDGERLRYTGLQVTSLIYGEKGTPQRRRDALEEFFQKASVNGLSRKDFIYIIENTKTNLTVPDCFYWPEYIGETCKNITIH